MILVSQSALLSKSALALGKIEILGELFAQTLSIVINLLAGENLAHFRLTAGITNQSRAAADKSNRFVAVLLHVRESHDRNEATDMQTGSRGVKTDIAGNGAAGEKLLRLKLHL